MYISIDIWDVHRDQSRIDDVMARAPPTECDALQHSTFEVISDQLTLHVTPTLCELEFNVAEIPW